MQIKLCVIFYSKKTAIDEIKEKQKSGMKNAVAGDAKYDSPGKICKDCNKMKTYSFKQVTALLIAPTPFKVSPPRR
jgi:hypothetical protein